MRQVSIPENRDNISLLTFLMWLTIAAFMGKAIVGGLFFQALALGFGFALFLASLHIHNFKMNSLIFAILLYSFVIYVISLTVNNFAAGSNFLPQVIACSSIAILILKYPPNHKIVLLLFYGMAAYFIYFILFGGVAATDLIKGSANQISVVMINLALFVYISGHLNEKKVSILPAFIMFFICVLSVGATGIVASFAIFLGILSYKLFGEGKFLRLLVLMSIILLLLIFTYVDFLNEIMALLGDALGIKGDARAKLDLMRYLGEDVRFLMWGYYLDTMDLGKFLVGRDLNANYLGLTNIHNAYLLFHARAGIFAFPVFIILIYVWGYFFFTNLVFFFCFTGLLVRAIGDTTMLGIQSFDWILIFFIFYAFKGTYHSQLLQRPSNNSALSSA